MLYGKSEAEQRQVVENMLSNYGYTIDSFLTKNGYSKEQFEQQFGVKL